MIFFCRSQGLAVIDSIKRCNFEAAKASCLRLCMYGLHDAYNYYGIGQQVSRLIIVSVSASIHAVWYIRQRLA